jgi:hypothetical protein
LVKVVSVLSREDGRLNLIFFSFNLFFLFLALPRLFLVLRYDCVPFGNIYTGYEVPSLYYCNRGTVIIILHCVCMCEYVWECKPYGVRLLCVNDNVGNIIRKFWKNLANNSGVLQRVQRVPVDILNIC